MEYDINKMLDEIKETIKNSNKLIIALDGLGGSGKSTFSEDIIKLDSRIEVIRMDDFYLPSKNRVTVNVDTNYDMDRLINQVIQPYNSGNVIKYQKYDWTADKLGDLTEVKQDKILLIEGVYSLHKSIRTYSDIKIWVECCRDLRLHRGLVRDGESAYLKWVNDWMVVEDNYVKNQNPKDIAQYIIYTDVAEHKYLYEKNN